MFSPCFNGEFVQKLEGQELDLYWNSYSCNVVKQASEEDLLIGSNTQLGDGVLLPTSGGRTAAF